MAMCVMRDHVFCRFKRFPQHLLYTRWFTGSFTHQSRGIHSSPALHLQRLNKLIDQGKRSILKLKGRDKVPEDYQLIYKASMELTLRIAYPIFVSGCLGLFGVLIYREFHKENIVVSKNTGRDGAIKFINPEKELWFFSVMILLATIAGASLVIKYPFRIYKHNTKQEYIGIYVSPVLFMLRQVQFQKAYPTKFKNPFYSIMKDCHFLLDGKKKTFFLTHFFRIPKDLTDMYEGRKNVS